MIPMNLVTEFYDVPLSTVNDVYNRNRAEIDSDGVMMYTPKKIKDFYITENPQSKPYEIEPGRRARTAFSFGGKVVEVPNSGIKFFSPRVVLHVGMLLRDSEVAKESRELKEVLQNATTLTTHLFRTHYVQRHTHYEKSHMPANLKYACNITM
ncbi:MAG: hypothetical protein IJO02_07865 [Clostridia bacterium]|nr:hypothetical protein [Clostridia bacterium]MBQ6859329.1 hypothetical protein [Clostridia bacterium]